MKFSDLDQKSTSWRAQIRNNKRKSRNVVLTFILLYVFIGLIVDTAVQMHYYPQAPVSVIFKALITLKIIPFATLIMAAIAGVSLLVTYAMHNKIMLLGTEYLEVTMESTVLEEKQLYNIVEEMKVAAGLNYMPRVFIIKASYMNAFASGFSEKSAMVAITSGLMEKLDRSEIQAVMAHEISHIRHLDIKLTLTVAVLSNLMLIIIDVLFWTLIYSPKRRNSEPNPLGLVVLILRFVLPVVTVLLMMYLSRTRELMADSGCVQLMRDNGPMARALLKIHNDHQSNAESQAQEYGQTPHEDVRRASYLYDPVKAGIEPVKDISSAFSTHPTLERRLQNIGFKPKE